MSVFDLFRRLEPHEPERDLDRGFRAEVADPVWFLGRQWQLGEHQAENASFPVEVRYRASHDPISSADSKLDPAVVPPEVIVESEPDDWWTLGRRIRIGREARPSVPERAAHWRSLRLPSLPPPYTRFSGEYDGRKLYSRRRSLSLPAEPFAEVPRASKNLWNRAELCYESRFRSGGAALALRGHDGGHVDWFSVDADQPVRRPSSDPAQVAVLPTPFQYAGAPHPRWWQIEDAQVDIGGFPPDRSHFATMLLVDLVVTHSDDWFTFPVATWAGRVVTLRDVEVVDSFDESYEVEPPRGWSLFQVRGLGAASLPIWPTVATPLAGDPVEEVVIGVDEDANLLWAVERRVEGVEVPTDRPEPARSPPGGEGETDVTAPPVFDYLANTGAAVGWHPYRIEPRNGRRRFVQGRLADLSATPPKTLPAARARVLTARGGPHEIEPAAVPSHGFRIQRRWMLGRGTDGRPLLWVQRRRSPLLAPPASELRFDLLREVPQVSPVS